MGHADHIEEEAALWVARQDAGPLDGHATEEFEAWRRRSSRHAGAFMRLQAVNARLDRAVALQGLPAERPAARRGWIPAAVAALLVLALAGAWQGGLLGHGPAATREFVTKVGQPYQTALKDGSLLRLDPDTHASITIEPRDRVVKLESGGAAFEVTRNPARPFVVHTPLADVRDIGTVFSVQVGNELVVTVAEGEVAIERAGHVLAHVAAGQRYTLTPSGSTTRQQRNAAELEQSFAWRQGRFAFAGETLGEAAKVFNRYNTVKIEIPDPQVRAMRFGGYYRVTDPEGFTAALAGALPVTPEHRGKVIILAARR